MAGFIDRAALLSAAALGFYLYFLNAWQSVPLACLLAYICCAILEALLERRPRRARLSRGEARRWLRRVAELPDEDAQRQIEALVRWRWPEESFTLLPLIRYPEASLSAGDVFGLWKRNRDVDRLLIACTCGCDSRAAALAKALNAPKVAIVDLRRLTAILRRKGCPYGQSEAEKTSLRVRLGAFIAGMRAKKPTPREALWGVGALALYLLWGNPLYLAVSLATLFHLGACLYHGSVPNKPF